MLETRYFYTDEFTRFLPIFEKYPHTALTVKKGECLKKPDTRFYYNDLILSGMARLSVLHASGEDRVVGYWGRGSMYPIITTQQDFFLEYAITLEALTDVSVLRYTTDAIRLIMKDVPEIAYEMIDHYCKFTNLFLYFVTTQAFEPLTNRVCNILTLYYQHFHDLEVPITQADLASLAGAKRESVVKVLRELRTEGLIETSSGRIRIRDIESMNAYISCLMQ